MAKAHPQDIVVVKNIDTGCNGHTSDIVRVNVRTQSPDGRIITTKEDREYSFIHNRFFEVRYGGRPIRIAPGKTRQLPRYIADHFAKHLADHMLQRVAEAYKNSDLLKDKNRWQKIYNSIIGEVVVPFFAPGEEDFEGETFVDPFAAAKTDNSMDSFFQGESFANPNSAPDPLDNFVKSSPTPQASATPDAFELPDMDLGDDTLLPLEATNELPDGLVDDLTLPNQESATTDDGKTPALYGDLKGISKDQLIAEAKELDIELAKGDTKEDIAAKIRQFAGG